MSPADDEYPPPQSTCLDGLPGWLLVICGMTVIGLAILYPGLQENRELVWKRGLMIKQAEVVTRHERAFSQYASALETQDPLLVQDLAYRQLRLKPVGAEIMLAGEIAGPSTLAPKALPELPVVGDDYPPMPQDLSRLGRLTRGPRQTWMILAGVALVLAGVFDPFSWLTDDEADAADDTDLVQAELDDPAELKPAA